MIAIIRNLDGFIQESSLVFQQDTQMLLFRAAFAIYDFSGCAHSHALTITHVYAQSLTHTQLHQSLIYIDDVCRIDRMLLQCGLSADV